MSNVFGILTAIVLALSAFVAFKNKEHYRADLDETQSQHQKLKNSEKRLAAAETELAGLPPQITEVDDEVEKLTGDQATQEKANAELTTQVKTKTDKIAADKAQLDAIREKTDKIGNVSELASKMGETNAKIEELKQSIAGSEAKLANLTAQSTAAEAQITSTKSKFEDFSASRSLPTLNTRIRSIYPNWGFVTLGSGNNAGVTNGSTLDVVRNGEVIAKLLVSGVEATTATATIVPDSIADDSTLRVGDRVVPGLKETKAATN